MVELLRFVGKRCLARLELEIVKEQDPVRKDVLRAAMAFFIHWSKVKRE
jgi:hypothetical protein